VSFLESIGAAFGACQNAYTSADETVYSLAVATPAGDLGRLDTALGVLGEFAGRIR
jgi:predicted Zn-dependent peptidase